jgi:endonuclease YncB( thermonuclease family)
MIDRRRALAGGLAATAFAGPKDSGRFVALAADAFARGVEEWRLIDIVAPDGRGAPDEAEALADRARAALQDLLDASPPDPAPDALRDRWGRRRVRPAFAGSTTSFQERLVESGAARVRPESDDAPAIAALLAGEAAARAARRGLWAHSAYEPFPAARANRAVGAFNLVEGVVLAASAGRGRTYLNFGSDYRTDFTATAPGRLARAFAKAGLDLAALQGARVRVRGFVAWINGPSIALDRREALERL